MQKLQSVCNLYIQKRFDNMTVCGEILPLFNAVVYKILEILIFIEVKDDDVSHTAAIKPQSQHTKEKDHWPVAYHEANSTYIYVLEPFVSAEEKFLSTLISGAATTSIIHPPRLEKYRMKSHLNGRALDGRMRVHPCLIRIMNYFVNDATKCFRLLCLSLRTHGSE